MRFANAQTYAFIDSDYILKNVPEYVEAKERLDKMAERWTKEIEERYAVIKTKKASFDIPLFLINRTKAIWFMQRKSLT